MTKAVQALAGVRFEWGEQGARALVDDRGALVVVDVLSFSTAVTIAEFLLNLTPLVNRPLRSTVEAYIVREFLQPNGICRMSSKF